MRTRYLKPGVVEVAIVATVVLVICRFFGVLVPNWWCVGLPALFVVCAYALVRAEHWQARRAIERNGNGRAE